MDNLSLEQLNSRLKEINKQIEDIENLSNNSNIETVTITTYGNVNKKISKDKVYLYMNLIEERQKIINQIRMLASVKNLTDNTQKKDNSNIDNSFDYQIINSMTHFKDGTIQRINENNSIISTDKKSIRFMEEPFKMMREQSSNINTRDDLLKSVVTASDNRRKIETAKKRILTSDAKGFISNAAFIVITSIFITIMIFLVVGFIVFR